MAREGLEVADVFRRFGQAFRDQHGAALSGARRRAMLAIERCRTAALGGHVERCGDCGHQRIAYNSCRNRNCPKCQGLARAQWLEDRRAELLDVPYFHVVFTVPDLLATICLALGIDPTKQNMSNVNRPIRIVDQSAKPMREVLV